MSSPADKPSATGLARIANAFTYSLEGIAQALRSEAAFRQEAVLAAVLIPLALLYGPGALAKALMIGSVILVLVVELINSAIEAAIDRISAERHALAKYAKDAGSAAVLLCLVNLVVIWSLLLWGR